MATSKKNVRLTTEKVEHTITIEVPEYVLTLNLEEARTLEVIFGNIGGSPFTSRRLYADNMHKALLDVLKDAAIPHNSERSFLITHNDRNSGSIYFKDNTAPLEDRHPGRD